MALTKCLKTFGKVIDVYIDEMYPVYNDSKIYKIKETRIEDIDILKIEETFRSFKSFRRWSNC